MRLSWTMEEKTMNSPSLTVVCVVFFFFQLGHTKCYINIWLEQKDACLHVRYKTESARNSDVPCEFGAAFPQRLSGFGQE